MLLHNGPHHNILVKDVSEQAAPHLEKYSEESYPRMPVRHLLRLCCLHQDLQR